MRGAAIILMRDVWVAGLRERRGGGETARARRARLPSRTAFMRPPSSGDIGSRGGAAGEAGAVRVQAITPRPLLKAAIRTGYPRYHPKLPPPSRSKVSSGSCGRRALMRYVHVALAPRRAQERPTRRSRSGPRRALEHSGEEGATPDVGLRSIPTLSLPRTRSRSAAS